MTDSPPPLGPLTWGLLPLVLVGLLGLAVPIVRVELPKREPKPALVDEGPRVPYQDELLPVIERPSLDPEGRRALYELHERLRQETATRGGILDRDRKRVAEILDRYRPK